MTTPSPSAVDNASPSPPSSGGGGGANNPILVGDAYDEACIICLEPFTDHNPFIVTRCKHEYHLQCILEWSQRSQDCPICSQLLVLENPACQELLAAVEAERHLRSRTAATPSHYPHYPRQLDQESYSGDSDFGNRIRQHLGVSSIARYARRREMQRALGIGPPQVLVFGSSESENLSPISTGSNSDTVSAASPINRDMAFKTRSLFGRPVNDTLLEQDSPGSSSLSDSIKSKWLVASARCKESISKGTSSIKEKILVRNTSVKELSKSVQREVTAGVAGVSRMIERLDLTVKRTGTSSPVLPFSRENSPKGKAVQDNVIAQALRRESEEVVQNVGLRTSPQLCGDVSG